MPLPSKATLFEYILVYVLPEVATEPYPAADAMQYVPTALKVLGMLVTLVANVANVANVAKVALVAKPALVAEPADVA